MNPSDAVIVGAGPAGAATAILLARQGRQVTLVDRASFPRRKPCGEGLFPAGVAALRRLGVEPTALPGRSVDAVRFSGGGHTVEAPLPGEGFGLRRASLDTALVETACRFGVRVRTGVRVTGISADGSAVTSVATKEKTIEGRCIVAADGARSLLRRLAGLDGRARPRRYGVSTHVSFSAPLAPVIDVQFGSGHELYITPVGGRSANVAILAGRETISAFAGEPEAAFRRVIEGDERFRGGYELEEPPIVAGPFPAQARKLWSGNLVLAGDAAGFHDPISGDGMTAGLLGAEACANAVGKFLDGAGERAFEEYAQRHRAIRRDVDILTRLSLFLGAGEARTRLAIRNLERRPEAFARLVEINSRATGLRSLRPRDFIALALGVSPTLGR